MKTHVFRMKGKTMKNFKDMINEKATDAGYPHDGSDFANDVANPKTIERINGFLGVMGQIEYLIPEHGLEKIRERLGRLSLSFEDVTLTKEGGKKTVSLKQFGGRFGEDDSGDPIDDDGISHRVEGGLSLEIDHQPTEGGTHFVRTRIV